VRLPHYAKAAKFAAAVGCTREHYRRIEAGTGFPSQGLMTKIITALEVGQNQADGLWVSWAMAHAPASIQDDVMVVSRTSGLRIVDAVLAELALMYDLGIEDKDDLTGIIETTLNDEEKLWRD